MTEIKEIPVATNDGKDVAPSSSLMRELLAPIQSQPSNTGRVEVNAVTAPDCETQTKVPDVHDASVATTATAEDPKTAGSSTVDTAGITPVVANTSESASPAQYPISNPTDASAPECTNPTQNE